MWLQRAALTHLRVGRVPVARGYQHGRPILNSTSRRCAISLRRASTISSRPQPKRVVDLEPARRVLRETFGHETFRPGQEEVIPRLLSGESMALSWPRHSGSSICYLVPAVLQSCGAKGHGITVVISCSIPFLRRTVDTLRHLGIPAAVYAPGKEHGDVYGPGRRVLAQIRQGKIRILYLYTPFCSNTDVIHSVKSAPGGVNRAVLVEANYLSPPENHLALGYVEQTSMFVKASEPKSLLLLLTSNCYADILRDVCQTFSMPESSNHTLSPLPPPNVQLHAHASLNRDEAAAFILQSMNERRGQKVIVNARGKMVTDVAAMLQRAGLDARAAENAEGNYTRRVLDQFRASKFDVLSTYGATTRVLNHPRKQKNDVTFLYAPRVPVLDYPSTAARPQTIWSFDLET